MINDFIRYLLFSPLSLVDFCVENKIDDKGNKKYQNSPFFDAKVKHGLFPHWYGTF